MNTHNENRRYVAGFGIAALLVLSACVPINSSLALQRAGVGGAGQGQGRANGTGAGMNAGQTQNRGNGIGNGRGAGGPRVDITSADAEGSTMIPGVALSATLSGMPIGALDSADAAGLAFMREEEKLAHDVYLTLGQKWTLPVFANIAKSEQAHTGALQVMLERYGLIDPAVGKAVGQFSDPALQKLYDSLVAQGSRSLADALTVGATIEDLDVTDLTKRQTEQADLQMVYDNLSKGSRNHLRAFTSQLKAQAGAAYQPQYLSPAEYTAIVTAAMERGPAK